MAFTTVQKLIWFDHDVTQPNFEEVGQEENLLIAVREGDFEVIQEY